MDRTEFLDKFEKALEQGLLKICGYFNAVEPKIVTDGSTFIGPDLEDAWDKYVKDYVADAVENFNSYPDSAIGFAAFLGMGVAHNWDKDWTAHSSDTYTSYYGDCGWDNMDDHILEEVLKLPEKDLKRFTQCIQSCAAATQTLMEKEQVEAGTELGFYVLARSYTVMFRIGASMELFRCGYRKTRI